MGVRDLLMLSQDITDMEVTDMGDTEVMEVMAMAVVMHTMERDLLMLKLMLSQDIMDMVDTEVMGDMDTEVTMARDLLMLSQDIMVMEDMDMVDIEVMEVMDMVADTMDKKLVHTIKFKAINHKFYFKTDSFSQLSKLLNKRIFFWK